ncbi:hypothetical protein [Methylocystis sp. ATCC 49242]|uniref:hypothetical protein n=1 Tax=Methylocystis sp. ATCC 49242 TaxID=622637 RepID=UPI0001F86AAC|nr:hypothetical protein [Methylocystis sp. ATCC 49242]
MNLNPEAFAKEPPDYDPAISPMSKRGEYEAALAAGREPVVPSGDFWHWLGETYPAPKQAAVKAPDASARALWAKAVAAQNAMTAQTQGETSKPAAANNHGWDEVVAKINAEARGRR